MIKKYKGLVKGHTINVVLNYAFKIIFLNLKKVWSNFCINKCERNYLVLINSV